MLTEQRQKEIVALLNNKGSITVSELVQLFNTSESTIRRDLTFLDSHSYIKKIHGGATKIDFALFEKNAQKDIRQKINISEKIAIATKAASLIEDGDIVYIDVGTTTEFMSQFITAKNFHQL